MPTIEKEICYLSEEAAYNTDPVIVAADAQIVFEPRIEGETGTLYRRGIQHVVQDPQRVGVIGMRQPTLSLKQELRGNPVALAAGVKPLCHDLWQACGFIGTYGAPKWSYVWTPSAAKSIWCELDQDGLTHTIGGCRGNMVLEGIPGERIMQAFTMPGKYHAPVAVASAAPTFTDTPPLFCEGITLQPYGDAPAAGAFGRVTKFTLDSRSEIYRHSDVNGTDGDSEIFLLGHGSPEDRGATLGLEVTRPGGADSARWWDRWMARTLSVACTMNFGSSTVAPKQTCKVTLARLVVDAIEDIQIGSLFGHKVTCGVYASAGAVADDGVLIEWEQH